MLEREPGWPPGSAARPRRLMQYRHCDGTGVSGTGAVATGVVWPDGHVALRWLADDRQAVSSTSLWSSVADLILVHGHGGDSEIVYLDPDAADEMTAGHRPRSR